MQFVVSGQSTLPIYEQIIGQVKTAIVSGQIKQGDMLPSIRALAKDLQISVITLPFAARIFSVTPLSTAAWCVVIILSLLPLPLVELQKRLQKA